MCKTGYKVCQTGVDCLKILFHVLFCFDPRTTTTTYLLIGSLRKLAIKNWKIWKIFERSLLNVPYDLKVRKIIG